MNTRYLVVCLALTGFIAPTGVRADAAAGEKVFKSRCANCHSMTSGLSTIAPDLNSIVGRQAGVLKGYQYSPALHAAGFVWTPEKLNKWLASPHNNVPETEMAFPGLKSETERADVVEFLEQHHGK